MNRLLLVTLSVVATLAPAPQPAPAAPAAGKRVAVAIQDLKYRPNPVEAEVGDTVVWTNNDDRDHTVTADDGSFDSGRLRKGKSWSRTFDKPGRYPYGSDPSPRTKGTVVVRASK